MSQKRLLPSCYRVCHRVATGVIWPSPLPISPKRTQRSAQEHLPGDALRAVALKKRVDLGEGRLLDERRRVLHRWVGALDDAARRESLDGALEFLRLRADENEADGRAACRAAGLSRQSLLGALASLSLGVLVPGPTTRRQRRRKQRQSPWSGTASKASRPSHPAAKR